MWFLQIEHSQCLEARVLKSDLNSINLDAGELCTFNCIMWMQVNYVHLIA